MVWQIYVLSFWYMIRHKLFHSLIFELIFSAWYTGIYTYSKNAIQLTVRYSCMRHWCEMRMRGFRPCKSRDLNINHVIGACTVTCSLAAGVSLSDLHVDSVLEPCIIQLGWFIVVLRLVHCDCLLILYQFERIIRWNQETMFQASYLIVGACVKSTN